MKISTFTPLLLVFGIIANCSFSFKPKDNIRWTSDNTQKGIVSVIEKTKISLYSSVLKGDFVDIEPPPRLITTIIKTATTESGYTYRLLKTKLAGENDIPIKATILSISKGNKILDAVILSLDFTFETEHFAHFVVTTDSIHIHRYEVEHLEFDKETGDIIGNRNTPDTTIYSSLYLIRDGHIIKQ